MHPTQCGIVWLSNSAAANTGYGTQTRLITPRLQAAGYTIAIAAFYGREGFCTINPDGILELPRLRDQYMNDIIEAHLHFCRHRYPEVEHWLVFSLIDPFVLETRVFKDLPWAAWCPVDSAPDKAGNLSVLQHCHWPIAMSKFGEIQLRGAGLSPLYVPHGIDTTVFQPQDRAAARARLSREWEVDLTNTFLIVENAANKGYPSRKNFDGLFRSVATFCADHPDINTRLYLHTEMEGIWQGERLQDMAAAYGIADRIIFPHQYRYLMGLYDESYLAAVYNAGDVLLHLAFGEGFGLPILEAQACGTPVIATDFSSMSELVFAGHKVPALPFGFHSPSQWGFPLVPEAVKGLRWAYENRENLSIRDTARHHTLPYDIDRVMQRFMLPALTQIFSELAAEESPDDKHIAALK